MVALRHVAIRARNLEKSRLFYEQGLGMQFVSHRRDGIAMDLAGGGVNLTLLPYDGPERAPVEEGTEFIHLGFLVDDAAATFRRLKALGSRVVRDDVKERYEHNPSAMPIGSFKALDPDGNVIDVSDRPEEWRTSPTE